MAVFFSLIVCCTNALAQQQPTGGGTGLADPHRKDSVYTDQIKEIFSADSIKLLGLNDSTFIFETGDTVLVLIVSDRSYRQKVEKPQPADSVVQANSKPVASAQLPEKKEGDNKWKLKGTLGFNFANVGLENWAGGGNSSISIGGIGSFIARKEYKGGLWEHNLRLAYGLTRVGNFGIEKSDDALQYSTQYSKKFKEHWSVSFRSEFSTQAAEGYKIDKVTRDRLELISNFMAPGRLEVSSGILYSTKDEDGNVQFSASISPATGKLTFVLADSVDETDYGLEEGNKLLSEVGAQFYSAFSAKVLKNISFQNTVRLFANYNRVQNIDVNWETLMVLKVNKFLNTNFATNMIYDDDTDIKVRDEQGEVVAEGPRLQFKHVLNVGVNFIF